MSRGFFRNRSRPRRLRMASSTGITLAKNLLQGGSTLKQIADVLRHRSLDTTGIYTKVDVGALWLTTTISFAGDDHKFRF